MDRQLILLFVALSCLINGIFAVEQVCNTPAGSYVTKFSITSGNIKKKKQNKKNSHKCNCTKYIIAGTIVGYICINYSNGGTCSIDT